jgi:hypothetical protein
VKILFLDCDGVLNGHEKLPGLEYCGIRPDCVARLNRVIAETDCQLVISSAWRYMIIGGMMTKKGFEYLLITHGVRAAGRLHGRTVSDEIEKDRAQQILKYQRAALYGYGWQPCQQWCVLDDDPMTMNLEADQWRLVKTDGSKGMTDEDAQQAIEVLLK